jgi:hypothetical protein
MCGRWFGWVIPIVIGGVLGGMNHFWLKTDWHEVEEACKVLLKGRTFSVLLFPSENTNRHQ